MPQQQAQGSKTRQLHINTQQQTQAVLNQAHNDQVYCSIWNW
jgi:hypothetical protein